MKKVWNYLANKLDNKSTWLAIGLSIPTAAALRYPYDLLSIVIAIIGVMCPDIPSVSGGNDAGK